MTHPEFSAEINQRNKKHREEFMGDWDTLYYTQIEGEFNERYAAFREKYGYLPLLI